MKKKILYIVLIIAVLLVGVACLAGKKSSILQNNKRDDKITEEVSDDVKSDEADKTEGTNAVEGLEIPLESGVEDEQSQMESSENDEDDNDNVELPAVPIQ